MRPTRIRHWEHATLFLRLRFCEAEACIFVGDAVLVADVVSRRHLVDPLKQDIGLPLDFIGRLLARV